MATPRTAIINTLRADSTLLGLLGGNSNRITVPSQVAATATFPLLVVRMGVATGVVADLPYARRTFELRAYFRPEAQNQGSWLEIDALLDRAQAVLHGASLSVTTGNFKPFYTIWDNFRSGDEYDWALKAYYTYDRYRLHGVLSGIPHYTER